MMEVLTIIALVVVPISAVLIGQHLQTRAKKREDKMNTFKILMTDRLYHNWSIRGVQELNLIDVVFADSQKVKDAWNTYRESLRDANFENQAVVKKIDENREKLLEAIAKNLGYRISVHTFQDPYIPVGFYNSMESQRTDQENMSSVLQMMRNFNFSEIPSLSTGVKKATGKTKK